MPWIDVQERALGAFEQDVLAVVHRVVKVATCVADVALERTAEARRLVADRVLVWHLAAASADQRAEFVEVLRHQIAQALDSQQIAHAHAAPAGLGLVRRADAAAGGADRVRAGLAHGLDLFVVRQDDVGSLADQEFVVGQQAALLDRRDFVHEGLRIDDHAGAEHALGSRVQHPRGDEMGDQLGIGDNQGMAGVGPAAVANHDTGFFGEEVDDLSLAFISHWVPTTITTDMTYSRWAGRYHSSMT